jgi:hypothetical protein
MTYQSEVLADSPIRYWPLDDASGSTADDATNNADGTYSGTPTLGVAGPIAGATAVSFLAASSQQVLCPFTGLSTAWSLRLWWKSGGTAGSVIFRDSTASNGWLMILTNSDADVQLRANGTNRTITGLGTTLDNGSWHEIVVTSSGTQVITYVDGSAVDTWSVSAAASTVATPFRFARNGTAASYYTGSYAQIAVYNTVLSGARVAATYAASSGGTSYAAAGTVAATSSGSGATPALKAVASGTNAGASNTTGAATSRLVASGTVAGTSTVTGSADPPSLEAAGTVAVTSGSSGSTTALLVGSGTVAGTSTVSATTGLRAVASGVVVAISDTVGDVLAWLGASGVVEAVSGVFGAASVPQVAVDTPDERTLFVGPDERTLVIGSEARVLTAAPEDRTLVVTGETRNLGAVL